MNKTKSLIVAGSVIIGLSVLLAIYFILISIGIIHTRTNELVLRTESYVVEYDGTSHQKEGIEVIKGNLNKGHRVEAIYTGKQTNIGKSSNFATAVILDEGDNDVTNNYQIEIEFGEIEVTKRKITFLSETESKPFDQIELVNDNYSIIEGTLLEGHYFRGESTSSIMFPGSIANTFIMNIYDSDNNRVTDNYEIDLQYGRIEIAKIPFTVSSRSHYKVYDGGKYILPDEAKILIEQSEDYKGNDFKILEGHRLIVTFDTPYLVEVGTIENTFKIEIVDDKGLSVTNMYDVTYNFGTLTVISSIYTDPNITRENLIYSDNTIITLSTDSNDNVYLRDFSFGDFDGKDRWKYAEKQDVTLKNPFNFIGEVLDNEGFEDSFLKISFNRKQVPYLTPYFTINNQGSNDIHNYGRFGNNYTSYNTNFYNYNYFYDGIKSSPSNALDKYNYLKHVQRNYLNIDFTLKEKLLEIGRSNGIDRYSETLSADIKSYIENIAEFDVNFQEIDKSVDNIVLYFLEEATSGIAQHFASAAVLMYRAYGIPARYVTGYFAESGKTHLSNKNAHAWVEIYIDEMGWIPVEVTNGFDKQEITIRPEYKKKEYDGENFYSEVDEYEILSGQLKPGHRFEIMTDQSEAIYDVTIYDPEDNNFIESYVIYDQQGNDVTNRYIVNKKSNRLDIFPRKVTIAPYYKKKEYDGEELYSLDEEYIFKDNTTIVYGDKLKIYTNRDNPVIDITGDRGYIDYNNNKIDRYYFYDKYGNDIGYRYDVTLEENKLEIFPRELKIKPEDKSKIYDGTELFTDLDEFQILEGSLLDNHKLSIYTDRNNPVINYNGPNYELNNKIISYTIKDEFDRDVADKYEVSKEAGYLNIARREINIKTDNVTFEYNSQEQSVKSGSIIDYPDLAFGDRISDETYIGTIKNVGSIYNTVVISIDNKEGIDSTYNYIINYEYGIVTMKEKLITVEGKIVERTLDQLGGYPLRPSHNDYIIHGDVYAGDEIQIELTGEIDYVGEKEFSIKVTLSPNYKVITKNGILRVLPPEY